MVVRESSLRQYRRLFADFQERLRDYCREHGLSCTLACTAVPYDELLLRMMRAAGVVEAR